MELRVWVDGVQRVVCGITEQTTVQVCFIFQIQIFLHSVQSLDRKW